MRETLSLFLVTGSGVVPLPTCSICAQCCASDFFFLNGVPFCFATQSVFADRSGVGASRFLAAAAACAVLVCFAAENYKSYWIGCITVVMVIVQQIFLHFGADDFPSRVCFKSAPK